MGGLRFVNIVMLLRGCHTQPSQNMVPAGVLALHAASLASSPVQAPPTSMTIADNRAACLKTHADLASASNKETQEAIPGSAQIQQKAMLCGTCSSAPEASLWSQAPSCSQR